MYTDAEVRPHFQASCWPEKATEWLKRWTLFVISALEKMIISE